MALVERAFLQNVNRSPVVIRLGFDSILNASVAQPFVDHQTRRVLRNCRWCRDRCRAREEETPAAKTPAAKTPAAKTPAAKTPAAKTPAAKTPAFLVGPGRPTPRVARRELRPGQHSAIPPLAMRSCRHVIALAHHCAR